MNLSDQIQAVHDQVSAIVKTREEKDSGILKEDQSNSQITIFHTLLDSSLPAGQWKDGGSSCWWGFRYDRRWIWDYKQGPINSVLPSTCQPSVSFQGPEGARWDHAWSSSTCFLDKAWKVEVLGKSVLPACQLALLTGVFQNAAINEALRLSSAVMNRLQLIEPKDSLRYKEWVIPPGASLWEHTTQQPMFYLIDHRFSIYQTLTIKRHPSAWVSPSSSKIPVSSQTLTHSTPSNRSAAQNEERESWKISDHIYERLSVMSWPEVSIHLLSWRIWILIYR